MNKPNRRIAGPGGRCSLTGPVGPDTTECVWIELGRDEECCLNNKDVFDRIVWEQ